MAEQFDPYSEWLGIAQAGQPANYYQLLGLKLYEANRELIARSASRQLRRLRPHVGGPHCESARLIATEIDAARLCLLTTKLKDAYDAKLRNAGTAAPPVVPSQPVPPSVPPPPTLPAAPTKSTGSGVDDPNANEPSWHISPRLSPSMQDRLWRRRRNRSLVLNLLVPPFSFIVGWIILGSYRPELHPFTLLRSLDTPPTELEPPPEDTPLPSDPRAERPAPPQPPAPRTQAPRKKTKVAAPKPTAPVLEKALEFLPDSVDLPPFATPGRFTIAERTLPEDADYDLLLISDSLAGQTDQRLELRMLPGASDAPTWAVYVVDLDAGRDLPTEDLAPPIAEFIWDQGTLQFQWKFATEANLRAALRNSLLNVRMDGEERLLQLRTPIPVAALKFDLSKKSLHEPLAIPDVPPHSRLRFDVTEAYFPGLSHAIEGAHQDVRLGQKVPIKITTSPGVNFNIWMAASADQLTIFAEGHYSLGGNTPIEFAQHRVEGQINALFRRRRYAAAAIPKLQAAINSLGNQINVLGIRRGKLPAGTRGAHMRSVLGLQIQATQRSLAAANQRLSLARETIPVATRGIAAVQEVAKLGSAIHNTMPVQYRVYLPLEYEGVRLKVVLLETVDSASPVPENEQPLFAVATADEAAPRHPVPPEEERELARAKLASEYRSDYEAANDPASQQRLATQLIIEANETSDDLPRQFELYRLAWIVLSKAGDISAALEVTDQVEQLYQLDRVALRASVIRSVVTTSGFDDSSAELVSVIMSVVDEAVLEKDYTIAIELLKLAIEVESRLSRPTRRGEFEDRLAFLEAEQQLAEKEAALLFNPDDAEMHLRVGRLALMQGRSWKDCLDILAKGGEAPLAAVSRIDLSSPQDPAAQVELADRWYELAELEEGEVKSCIEQRAAHWYGEALPHLSGFSKTKAETRLRTLEGAADAADASG